VFGWCDLPGPSGSGCSLDGGKTSEPFASFDEKTQKARGGMTGAALDEREDGAVVAEAVAVCQGPAVGCTPEGRAFLWGLGLCHGPQDDDFTLLGMEIVSEDEGRPA
jgi:hypothetical protein